MEAAPEFLSCDWGTTSFRLRHVRGVEREIAREISESAGVKSLYEEATRLGAETESARAKVFSEFLRAKLEKLFANKEPSKPPLPLVISGMASSSIGWRELPYARTPFPLDGRWLVSEQVEWNKPEWIGPTHLISGLATDQDIMRGEESEIIGLLNQPSLAPVRERCLLILPGTHSKHVLIENHAIVNWRTFMTGELFELLGRQSILRASIEPDARHIRTPFSESERSAFLEGLQQAHQDGLAGTLFRVRTRALLDRHPSRENTCFLSGVLIGAELMNVTKTSDDHAIVLAATRALAEPYALALQAIAGIAGDTWRCIHVEPERIAYATVAAHALFLRTHPTS
jgi:2-dehydro-3-deoxygalactonokinase